MNLSFCHGLSPMRKKKNEDIEKFDIEIQQLEEQLKALKNKRFERKCDLASECVRNEDYVHEDFKQLLLDAILKEKLGGYKSKHLFI